MDPTKRVTRRKQKVSGEGKMVIGKVTDGEGGWIDTKEGGIKASWRTNDHSDKKLYFGIKGRGTKILDTHVKEGNLRDDYRTEDFCVVCEKGVSRCTCEEEEE